jgi:hypothetical protein
MPVRVETDSGEVPSPDRVTFVVRLWREREEAVQWRGLVEHVQHGERRPVTSLTDLAAQLAAWLQELERLSGR